MSKFVKIPSYKNPYEVIINGVKYQYPAGETCLVPDGVAMVIKNAENNAPKYAKENVRRPDIVETVSGEVIKVSDSVEAPLQGLKVFGKTIQNGTPTPDAPVALESVGVDGNVTVTVVGKNLLNNTANTMSEGGITFTVNDDRSVTANGISTSEIYFKLNAEMNLGAGNYILTGNKQNTLFLRLVDFTYDAGGKFVASFNDLGNGINVAVTDESIKHSFQIYVPANATLKDVTFHPMLRLASVEDGTYEPYKETNITTIYAPNGLLGIPVASGGNYKDAKGQQWICDEVDFENGVYVQRVGKIDSYNGEALPGAYLSSTGELSTGATVLYQFASDKKTDINKAKLAAYAAMHTNCPSTTVYNDAGAGMELKYVADTKLYVDNKFNVLAAMVNNA